MAFLVSSMGRVGVWFLFDYSRGEEGDMDILEWCQGVFRGGGGGGVGTGWIGWAWLVKVLRGRGEGRED